MNNKKSTKRTLLTSVLSLVLCMAMLVGTTFAWFTDSVTSGSNVIQSGNLDIEVEYTTDGENWNDLNGATDLFQKGLWEPGHTEVVALKIVNNGSLNLKYAANMNIFKETVGKTKEGNDIVLSDILTVSAITLQANDDLGIGNISLGIAFDKEDGLAYGAPVAFKSANVLEENQELHVGDSHYVIIKVDMAEKVGNEANHDGVNIPSIDFGINVLATQFTRESDTFGNQYDKYASVSTVAKMKEALEAGITEFNFMGSTVNFNCAITKSMVPKDTTITISNANVNGRSYGNGVDGTVIFENCTFTNTGAYSIHFDNGAGDVIFKNCTLYGWISFGSSLNSVSFYDSALYGNGKYALIRSYVDLYLENCTYDISNADHTDVYTEGIEAVNGAELEMVNCSKVLASAEAFIDATEGGDISITEDIVYNNTDPNKQMILESQNAINFDGNGKTITTEGADPSIGNHGYVAFVPPAGEDVTVSDLTVTGTGFVELGDYSKRGGDYVANNLVVKDLVSTLANGDKGKTLACGFAHYGNATLNNCVMTGTTAMIDGAMAVDAGFVNETTTVVNGGKYGTVYCWSHAVVTLNNAEVDTLYVAPIKGTVTIASGTHIGTLNVDYGTSDSNAERLAKIVIEDGATIDAIVFEGTTYTQAEWLAR